MRSCCLLLKIAPLFRSAVTRWNMLVECFWLYFCHDRIWTKSRLEPPSVRLLDGSVDEWQSRYWLFLQVVWQHQQLSNTIKTLHAITSLLWYEGMCLGEWQGLMIQLWSHPCWPNGTSDNDEAVLTSTAELLSHIQLIKMWKYKHLCWLNAALQIYGL